ncbi:mitochondrial carrier domain-containing protein [Phellopilus nigrolimitatus]|nr:mitochondrial carrier domain-containing protein [Phellopilus nigrolimitatus]
MSIIDSDGQAEQGNSLYAALARTLTRSVALYFSRPVRLFRPSKVSGWMFLQGLASQKGVSLSPKFISHLVKKHGLFVLPRHFIPPLAVNAVLGTVLWETYSETTNFLEGHMSYPLAISLLSGAIAGGAQAVVAAPAENVRLVLEGGGNHAGWSSVWRDVFLGRQPEMDISKAQNLREARQVRQWMKEVGEMAGRGWFGFGWGFCKDVCGFAIFFSIFELTRRTALTLKSKSLEVMNALEGKQAAKSHVPRVVHGMTLVGGGVLAGLAYEMSSRPFDLTRRIVHAQHVTDPKHSTASAVLQILTKKARDDGILSFFRAAPVHESAGPAQSTSVCRRRMFSMLRVLGRVGPWGAGFLMWEAFGPGLS